jgi:hypothetical protein
MSARDPRVLSTAHEPAHTEHGRPGLPATPTLPAGAARLSPWTDLALTGDATAARAPRDPGVTLAALRRAGQFLDALP